MVSCLRIDVSEEPAVSVSKFDDKGNVLPWRRFGLSQYKTVFQNTINLRSVAPLVLTSLVAFMSEILRRFC